MQRRNEIELFFPPVIYPDMKFNLYLYFCKIYIYIYIFPLPCSLSLFIIVAYASDCRLLYIVRMHHYNASPVAPPTVMDHGSWSALTLPYVLALNPDASLVFLSSLHLDEKSLYWVLSLCRHSSWLWYFFFLSRHASLLLLLFLMNKICIILAIGHFCSWTNVSQDLLCPADQLFVWPGFCCIR